MGDIGGRDDDGVAALVAKNERLRCQDDIAVERAVRRCGAPLLPRLRPELCCLEHSLSGDRHVAQCRFEAVESRDALRTANAQ